MANRHGVICSTSIGACSILFDSVELPSQTQIPQKEVQAKHGYLSNWDILDDHTPIDISFRTFLHLLSLSSNQNKILEKNDLAFRLSDYKKSTSECRERQSEKAVHNNCTTSMEQCWQYLGHRLMEKKKLPPRLIAEFFSKLKSALATTSQPDRWNVLPLSCDTSSVSFWRWTQIFKFGSNCISNSNTLQIATS